MKHRFMEQGLIEQRFIEDILSNAVSANIAASLLDACYKLPASDVEPFSR